MMDTVKNPRFVQIYTGDGKGKTTAAIGQAIRAAGHGLKSYILQFMKGNIEYGELEIAKRLAPLITIYQGGRETFVNKNNPEPIDIDLANKTFQMAKQIINSGEYDIVVLDEINVAIDYKLIDIDEVVDLIKHRPLNVELILTGRGAHPRLIELADLVTEMIKVKHYYDKGVLARTGFEI